MSTMQVVMRICVISQIGLMVHIQGKGLVNEFNLCTIYWLHADRSWMWNVENQLKISEIVLHWGNTWVDMNTSCVYLWIDLVKQLVYCTLSPNKMAKQKGQQLNQVHFPLYKWCSNITVNKLHCVDRGEGAPFDTSEPVACYLFLGVNILRSVGYSQRLF